MSDEQKPADEPVSETQKVKTVVFWMIAFGLMSIANLGSQVTIAMKNRSISNLQSTISYQEATIGIQLQQNNELKLQLDVLRRAELDRQMQWRKNFLPSEVRELFET